jgi:histidyl-tRNA synthetase
MSAARNSPASFLKHASDVASFYGFRPARELERIAADRLEKRRGAHSFEVVARASVMCSVLRPGEPSLAFYANATPLFLPRHFVPQEMGEFTLMVAGSAESVSEVVLLKTLAAIIVEWGMPVTRVRVNALGDKDSQQRFGRELSLYVRKQVAGLSEKCREHAPGNPLSLYGCEHVQCREILRDGPRPINFLSERSRLHFREVLEHLEKLGLPYELDDLLAGDERDPNFSFAFDLAGEDGTVNAAIGGRFDDFFRRASGRSREGVGVAGSIYFRKKGASRSTFSALPIARAPKIYFIQLGTRAKLQGLSVLDTLRRARIPVSQSFDATRLSPQLLAAKELGVSHMLIMGQREAIDGTIIVRSTINSSQDIIQLAELPRFLKTLR